MAREYHFTPAQVGKLTPYQLKCYLKPEHRLEGEMGFKSFKASERWLELMNDPDWVLTYLRGRGLKR